jgi:hypothetical protein
MSAHQPARLASGACRSAFRRRQHSGHTPLLVCGPRPADVPGDREVHIGGAVAGPVERSTEPAMGGPQGASAGGGLGDQSGQRGVLMVPISTGRRGRGGPVKLASPAWKPSASISSRVFGGGDRYATGMPGYGLDPRMARPSATSWAPVR